MFGQKWQGLKSILSKTDAVAGNGELAKKWGIVEKRWRAPALDCGLLVSPLFHDITSPSRLKRNNA